ncbi:hypothetical protein [Mycobacterium asiaticum]|uniref:hypothetical protein n=1 Tax=Mycobacterium asiaticum TaxID=1790 RepID=UPI0007EFC2D6|nr:hypothetical protein [Mycobacterium asiaticum]OBJ50504.1 hypothetical protein A9W94_28255 [Mycobacterium asiaticum]OBJ66508.1 hypothetical protein A9W94_00645 [Mycobacterium asiaticum]
MTALATLFALALALKYLWLLVAAVMLAGVVHVVRAMITAASEQRALAWREAQQVAARADEQQELVLAGDERGVYGMYEPAL